MENESKVNEHEFDDVLSVIEKERESSAPRYCSLPESIFGEMRRMSENEMKQIRKMEEGGKEWS